MEFDYLASKGELPIFKEFPMLKVTQDPIKHNVKFSSETARILFFENFGLLQDVLL
jgi:hypothetical protein